MNPTTTKEGCGAATFYPVRIRRLFLVGKTIKGGKS